jgi:hypothetical protein
MDMLIDHELYGPRSNLYHAVTDALQRFSGVRVEIKNAFPGDYPAMFDMGGSAFSLPEVMELFDSSPAHGLKEAVSRLLGGTPRQTEVPPGLPVDMFNNVFEDMAWKFGVMFQDARDASQERTKRLVELLQSESNLTRCAAALTLPWYSKEEALVALEQATHDPDELVRKAATWAFQALQKVILYRKQSGL